MQYCTVPYSTVLYHIVLYSIILYSTVVGMQVLFVFSLSSTDGRTDGRTDRDCSRGPSGPKKRAVRLFQQGEGPSRGLLRDC